MPNPVDKDERTYCKALDSVDFGIDIVYVRDPALLVAVHVCIHECEVLNILPARKCVEDCCEPICVTAAVSPEEVSLHVVAVEILLSGFVLKDDVVVEKAFQPTDLEGMV